MMRERKGVGLGQWRHMGEGRREGREIGSYLRGSRRQCLVVLNHLIPAFLQRDLEHSDADNSSGHD
jgi:hypothetical protein